MALRRSFAQDSEISCVSPRAEEVLPQAVRATRRILNIQTHCASQRSALHLQPSQIQSDPMGASPETQLPQICICPG